MAPATLGVATNPVAYLTMRALRLSSYDCNAAPALFVTFENAMVTQSRHILLDSPLVFFTALTIFLWSGFCNEDRQSPIHYAVVDMLTLSGLSLGAVASCKWVGLFTIATAGASVLASAMEPPG